MTSISARPQLGTGDEVEPLALPEAQGLEQLPPGPRLFHRVGGERVADGVADALGQQRGDPGRPLQQPGRRRAGLGHPEVERVVEGLRRQPVGLDHQRHRGGLDRDLHVVEAHLGEVGELHAGRLHQRLGSGPTEPLVQIGVERSGVHADADGHAPVLRLRGHLLDLWALRRLPGLSRSPCTPASRAASAISWWKWMSAMIGTGERGMIRASPSAAASSLQVQRTMSAPAAASA